MEVRACERRDLAALERSMLVEGPYGHKHRLVGQAEGRWLYLLAVTAEPIGSCLVHWRGLIVDNGRHELPPHCVEITNVYVVETARRRASVEPYSRRPSRLPRNAGTRPSA
jgi:hypothetical protein